MDTTKSGDNKMVMPITDSMTPAHDEAEKRSTANADYWRDVWENEWQKSEAKEVKLSTSAVKEKSTNPIVENLKASHEAVAENQYMMPDQQSGIKNTILTNQNIASKISIPDVLHVISNVKSIMVDNCFYSEYPRQPIDNQCTTSDAKSAHAREVQIEFENSHRPSAQNIHVIHQGETLHVWIRDFSLDESGMEKMLDSLQKLMQEKNMVINKLIINGKIFYIKNEGDNHGN